MPLLGLTEEQATLRLKVETGAARHRYPGDTPAIEEDRGGGAEAFRLRRLRSQRPSTFAPATDVPVPSDYVVGAGDELNIQFYGKENRTLKQTVGRDGRISLPGIGPDHRRRPTFDRASSPQSSRACEHADDRRARHRVDGRYALHPRVRAGRGQGAGQYTISGLGTITSALYAAGGVKKIGSLRNIMLKRHGVLVRRLDLYDLLIRGDSKDDTKLLQGDVIFIPPVGATVSVDGEVRRPAIYETRNESTVADVVQLAGGLTPGGGSRRTSMLTRIEANQHRVVLAVESGRRRALAPRAQRRSAARLARCGRRWTRAMMVQGHVFTPGRVRLAPGHAPLAT